MPPAHMARLAAAARAGRLAAGEPGEAAPVETVLIPDGQHSWLYEFPEYRRAVARFVARAFDGPLAPDAAGEIAAATVAERIPDAENRFARDRGHARRLPDPRPGRSPGRDPRRRPAPAAAPTSR